MISQLLRTLRKWLIILSIVIGAGFILFRGIQYRLQPDALPLGTSVAGIDVSGLTIEEARRLVGEKYYAPLYLYHKEEHIELNPKDVGFELNMESMFNQLNQLISGSSQWFYFGSFLTQRPLRTINIPLQAGHDPDGLRTMVQSISELLDQPAQGPQMLGTSEKLQSGREGYVTDVDSSVASIAEALYSYENRDVQLTVKEQPIPERNLDILADAIEGELQVFNGLGSIFIMDLSTGEEMAINADVALSGLSILKIAIFVEAYRAIDGPLNEYQEQLFLDAATRSSNFAANLLLHEVAGEDNTYLGADVLTESMARLGLVNTFMAVPYDANPPAYRRTTYVTPANSRSDINTEPDPTMQSTAEEIGSLLSMIYYCARGGGTLIAIYGDEITPEECQAIIDLMILNVEGNLIRFGVPQGTPVSHKHGWAQATHADAGIVFSPGGDYVIVEYLNQSGDWLLAEVSFPILREIARAAYNYFNVDEPYLSDAMADRGFIDPEDPFSENQAAGESEPDIVGDDNGVEIENGESGAPIFEIDDDT
ncbi:MAG: serine hydrolase [Anaerolineae bacterium]|nr:MAG: serine hydrolase [Anaerolineae bacterium]